MSWEFDILYAFQSIRNPVLDMIMVEITEMGDAGKFWILLSIGYLFGKKTRKCGVTMLLSLGIMILFGNVVLKNIFMRERPCWIDQSIALLIANPHDYSFPSGHTYSSVAAASVMYCYDKLSGFIALVVAALIAISRMYLFVHFPTDVLASCILGIVTALLSVDLVNKYYDSIKNKLTKGISK